MELTSFSATRKNFVATQLVVEALESPFTESQLLKDLDQG